MSNHIYIITGASSGLGAELTRQLLAEDNVVYCLSRTENTDIVREASGYRYQFIAIDLTRVETLNGRIQEMISTIDPSHLDSITLINNAAMVSPIKDIEACTQEEIMLHIQLNLTAPVLLSSSFISLTSGWNVKRRLVNISSGSAKYPAPSMSLYCSTKSALNMFSQCVGLEQEDEPHAVQVFAVDPGMMDTEMQKKARDSDFPLTGYFTKQKEEGNLADPVDVAHQILTLINAPLIKNGDIHRV
ncbi:SDR family NAD(P)-dependent oxidoreductase [Paenibacillus qinlingensis]|uniref:Benzil reductase ((S)-benzoin forming) n=1 Tax=Paenibacillus qinlingensis TaxID=1837343 RepID=A0ABU1NW00_9BACL|nr:SDR family NAD(P)-dependent oxidoreductase [Paenibacillus qinlingensis]MDR6551658.1 benzil reductase ((S)-benzoin forming) [Paenibacillus qinlingensis]